MSNIFLETETGKKIFLRNIIECDTDIQNKIRDIRNSDFVRKFMYSQHIIPQSEHQNWLAMLSNNPEKHIVFVVLDENNEPHGILSVTHIDKIHQKASWAFYLTPQMRGGVGKTLERFVLDFAFNTLHINKLDCEVLQTNEAVINLHLKFGFEQEGVKRDHCFIDNQFQNVVLMGITKNDYLKMSNL